MSKSNIATQRVIRYLDIFLEKLRAFNIRKSELTHDALYLEYEGIRTFLGRIQWDTHPRLRFELTKLPRPTILTMPLISPAYVAAGFTLAPYFFVLVVGLTLPFSLPFLLLRSFTIRRRNQLCCLAQNRLAFVITQIQGEMDNKKYHSLSFGS
jgi:hypothetical protein